MVALSRIEGGDSDVTFINSVNTVTKHAYKEANGGVSAGKQPRGVYYLGGDYGTKNVLLLATEEKAMTVEPIDFTDYRSLEGWFYLEPEGTVEAMGTDGWDEYLIMDGKAYSRTVYPGANPTGMYDYKIAGEYDLVVVGAGIAGMSAAVSAARLGCKVALLNDRPVIGGNNSSEIRVHLGGRIEAGPYKELGNLQKEFGPTRGGNAQPADYYEDQKKMDWLLKEKNVSLFTNYRAIAVEKEGNRITAVIAKHIETGEEKRFEAPLFSDCTGDGTIGYLAGADYRMGRESRDEFGESTAPEQADKMTMGASVQWYSEDTKKASSFPQFEYGVDFNEKNCEKVTMGEWTWETGMNYDQIKDFERIRDYGLMVVYSNWSYLKNEMKENDVYKNRKLAWVAYISGKRESRRLMGDYILKEEDLRKHVVHEDGSAASTWSIDLHYPDPKNTENFPGQEFKSIAKHINIYPYPIPYRCLYSRNIDNLFMAGRNISVTHVALGTVRVMRTTGMMGEVVGMAASICKKYQVNPRGVYRSHLPELKELMKEGVGQKGLPNNQQYNEGGTLKEKPVVR